MRCLSLIDMASAIVALNPGYPMSFIATMSSIPVGRTPANVLEDQLRLVQLPFASLLYERRNPHMGHSRSIERYIDED